MAFFIIHIQNVHAQFDNNPFPFINIMYVEPGEISLLIAQSKDPKIELQLDVPYDCRLANKEMLDLPIEELFVAIFAIKTNQDFEFTLYGRTYHVKMPNEEKIKIGFLKLHPFKAVPKEMHEYLSDCNLLINIPIPETQSLYDYIYQSELREAKSVEQSADMVKQLYSEAETIETSSNLNAMQLMEIKKRIILQYVYHATTNESMHNLFATTPMIFYNNFHNCFASIQSFSYSNQLNHIAMDIHNVFGHHLTAFNHTIILPKNQAVFLINDEDNLTKPATPKKVFDTLFVLTPHSVLNPLFEMFYEQRIEEKLLAQEIQHSLIKKKNQWNIGNKAQKLINILFATKEPNICNNLLVFDCDLSNTTTYKLRNTSTESSFFIINSISINGDIDEQLDAINLHDFNEYKINWEAETEVNTLSNAHHSISTLNGYERVDDIEALSIASEDPKRLLSIARLHRCGNDTTSAFYTFANGMLKLHAQYEERDDDTAIAINLNPEIINVNSTWQSISNFLARIFSV